MADQVAISAVVGRVALAAALAVAGTPALAAPATLACAGDHDVRWGTEAPQVTAIEDDAEFGRPIIHLAPASGEWFLEVPGSRALTNDGGTFTIVHESGFGAYYDEWVGTDHDTMLRIWGGGSMPLRFLFVSRDASITLGECTEPDEPVLFLREPGDP